MEQHAIPQQISSYEFRLVGSMTLKQFFKLAGGLLVAFIVYSSQLVFLVKWPLVFIFAAFGFALAFLPINERPLDLWIGIFIRGVLLPTVYLWKKQPTNLDILDSAIGYRKDEDEEEELEEALVGKKPQAEEFLASLPPEKITEKEELAITQPVEKEVLPSTGEVPQRTEPGVEIFFSKPPEATAEPEFGEIPMPKPPTTPNVIVGMITDKNGKILENAIVEIQDAIGNPVRALRSNQLGQFRTTAPLANGEYTITIEREGYWFDIIKVAAEGKVIPTLKIKAKS